MNVHIKRQVRIEPSSQSGLLDVLIRAGLIAAMAVLCYRIFSPFLTITMWACILAVTLYPLHQLIAARIGRRQGWAASIIVILGIIILVVPTALLMSSLGDSIQDLVHKVQSSTLEVPPPNESVKAWPIVGEKVYAKWTQAHDDLPGLVQGMQPKIGELAKGALAFVASIGTGLLLFLGSFVIAGIVMAFGQSAARVSRAVFTRIAGPERGAEFTTLSTATIRAVAQGVIGVAFIQAIVIGLVLMVAGVPWAGVLAIVALVLGIAQVPAFIVTLPAIAWIWWTGDYSQGSAILWTVLLFLAGMVDNILKPLMLGRGVDAPMPVILLGALGGMATAGILGMFVGATLLALGYQLFMGWVSIHRPPDEVAVEETEVVETSA